MQRKKRGRKNTPIRYVVEHVYSGTESMEGLLTVVSEEAARRNVEKRLRGNMETEKKAVWKDELTVDARDGKGYNEVSVFLSLDIE